MRRVLLSGALFVLVGSLSIEAYAAPDSEVDEIREDQPEAPPGYERSPMVRLSDVLASPDAFRTAPFRIVGQFYGFGEVFSPFYTPFDSGVFVNFAAWGGSDPIWERSQFVRPHSLFYVSRKNRTPAQGLMALHRFDRFHAVAIVRSSFRGRAWIEILHIDKLESSLDDETVGSFIMGFKLKDAGEFDLASLRFAEVRGPKTPPFAQKVARMEEGRCLIAAGAYSEAAALLAHAAKQFPFDTEFKRLQSRAVAYVTGDLAPMTAELPSDDETSQSSSSVTADPTTDDGSQGTQNKGEDSASSKPSEKPSTTPKTIDATDKANAPTKEAGEASEKATSKKTLDATPGSESPKKDAEDAKDAKEEKAQTPKPKGGPATPAPRKKKEAPRKPIQETEDGEKKS